MSRGLGDTCQWPQAGVPMYYPACTGTAPQLAQPAPSSSGPVQVTPGVLQFSNLTGASNSALAVGDRWQLRITGATPGQPVKVVGGKNGANDPMDAGATDGQGNFSMNGQATSDQIGTWREAWTVGGVPAGSLTFTIAGAPPAKTPAPGAGVPLGTAPAVTVGFDAMGLLLIGGGLIGLFLLTRR